MSREKIEKMAKAAWLDYQKKNEEQDRENRQTNFDRAKPRLVEQLHKFGIEIDEAQIVPLLVGDRCDGAVWTIEDLRFSHDTGRNFKVGRKCPIHEYYATIYAYSLVEIGSLLQGNSKELCLECRKENKPKSDEPEKQPRIMTDAEAQLIDAIYELTYRGEF